MVNFELAAHADVSEFMFHNQDKTVKQRYLGQELVSKN